MKCVVHHVAVCLGSGACVCLVDVLSKVAFSEEEGGWGVASAAAVEAGVLKIGVGDVLEGVLGG